MNLQLFKILQMNRLKYILFAVALLLCGCEGYDDSALRSDIDNLKDRVSSLESLCSKMNENISSLQQIVSALQTKDYVVSVTDLPDGAGYTVTFTSGKVIYLYNGKDGVDGDEGTDGKDGVVPKISVKLDVDGNYYWTLDGEWLLVDGRKVRASGKDGEKGKDGKDGKDGADGKDGKDGKDAKDGVTPVLKIEDGYWYVSCDNGATWSKLGKAVGENGKDGLAGKDGDSFFKSVTVEDGYAIFVMNDTAGTTFRLPVASAVKVTAIKYIPEYSDGKARTTYSFDDAAGCVTGTLSMDWDVYPSSAAGYLVENLNSVLKAKAVMTKAMTRSHGEIIPLRIRSVSVSDGCLSVDIAIDSLNRYIGKDFYSDPYDYSVSLCLYAEDGERIVASEYVEVQLYKKIPVIEYRSTESLKASISSTALPDGIVYSSEFTGYNGRIKIGASPDSPLNISFNSLEGVSSIKFLTPVSVIGLSFNNGRYITELDLDKVNTSYMTDMGNMFYNCRKLASIDLSGFNTSNVTSMGSMFTNCYSLASLDLSGFDTSNVTDMGYMFSFCQKLASLNLSGFDTSNVTDMGHMFDSCISLVSLDLSGFDTSNVTSMNAMFWNCKSLASLDLSGFDTSNVTSMESMFDNCWKLASLDLSGFDTSNVTSMRTMFDGCSSLASLDLSGFDTSNVTDMKAMFSGCSSLASLDLSGFDTSNVTSMDDMFNGCGKLASLDLSGFDMSNVTNMRHMFDNCDFLQAVIMRKCDNSTISKVKNLLPSSVTIITE